jgi:hypothetical protein
VIGAMKTVRKFAKKKNEKETHDFGDFFGSKI